MRATLVLLLTCLLTLFFTAAEARESSRSRIHPDRRETGQRFHGDRSYMTPGTEFRNDLRGYGGIHDDYRYRYATPWWAVPGDPFANSFSRGVAPHAYRYRQRPGISLRYSGGDWNANFYTDFGQPGYGAPCYSSAYPYSYGRGCNEPFYGNAADYGNHNYYGPQTAYPVYAEDYRDRRVASQEQQPQVYNDNRVYNYTFNDSDIEEPVAVVKQSVKTQPKASKADKANAGRQPTGNAIGRQFHDQLQLDAPDGAYAFALRKGSLYAGPEDGKATRLSANCDSSFGAYAAWLPGTGACVIYCEGASLRAAYMAKGAWRTASVPQALDPNREVTVGMVGGQPWLVFTSADASRYVVRFDGQAWQEVGSGTTRR